jgi:hypothetical protein
MRTHPLLGSTARSFFCAAICAFAAAAGVTPVRALADVDPNAHGVISSINGASLSGGPQLTWGPELAAMHDEGVQEVRSDAAWAGIQPTPPSSSNPGYQWAHYDAWVGTLASNGLTWEPILDYNTSWASAELHPQAFAAFARAVAARYGVNGTFWAEHPLIPYLPARIFEIWNEENVVTRYYMDPAGYGRLYLAARKSIKAIDPSASVDIGGLGELGSPPYTTDSAAQYMALLLITNPMLRGAIDAIALHPYASSAADSAGMVAHFRHAVSALGVGDVPLDLTEFGWAYAADRESQRATQMGALGDVLSRSDCGIRMAAPYDWINPNSPGDDFGLVGDGAGSILLRPAGAAWFSALGQGTTEPTLSLC